jgi:hypothetical protein
MGEPRLRQDSALSAALPQRAASPPGARSRHAAALLPLLPRRRRPRRQRRPRRRRARRLWRRTRPPHRAAPPDHLHQRILLLDGPHRAQAQARAAARGDRLVGRAGGSERRRFSGALSFALFAFVALLRAWPLASACRAARARILRVGSRGAARQRRWRRARARWSRRALQPRFCSLAPPRRHTRARRCAAPHRPPHAHVSTSRRLRLTRLRGCLIRSRRCRCARAHHAWSSCAALR